MTVTGTTGDDTYTTASTTTGPLNIDGGDGADTIDLSGIQSSVSGSMTRVSVDSLGVEGDNDSFASSISGDGRYVAFSSDASNLVAGDNNGATDIFLYDRDTGVTERVSMASAGGESDSYSDSPSISSDGRYVTFASNASNLVAGDTNGVEDIFVHDRVTGTTERVSVANDGGESFGPSFTPSISSDGRYVTFASYASNLVDGGDANVAADIFVRDVFNGTTERVSVASGGGDSNNPSSDPSISADGRYVAFSSDASNLVAGDGNGWGDIFVYDRDTQQTIRVSLDSDGNQSNQGSFTPSISSDGHYVAFSSYASNLVAGDTNGAEDIFVRDIVNGTTERISVDSLGGNSDGGSYDPSISSDGRYVTFASDATNLVAGDTNGSSDIFVYDRDTHETIRVSLDSLGGDSNNASSEPSISAGGRYVTFTSNASDLVAGDASGHGDVFVYDRFAAGSTVNGGDGDDRLISAGGVAMTGGAGADHFQLNSSAPTNRDQILDFNAGEGDTIDFLVASFTGTSAGPQTSTTFGSSADGTFGSADERFHYNTTTHELSYDADGNGTGHLATVLADLDNGATVAAANIHGV
jgi:Tol biopolymer transport system component